MPISRIQTLPKRACSKNYANVMSYQTRRQTLQILYVHKIKVSMNHPSKSNVNTSNNYVL